MKSSSPKFGSLARLSKPALAIAALATAASSWGANSTSLTMTDSSSRTASESLQFGPVTGGVTENNVAAGSYQVKDSSNNSFWVYCLDPMTWYTQPNTYTITGLSNFLTGGGYSTQFSTGNYTNPNVIAAGFKAQNTSTVLNNLMSLYNHAYADSQTSAVKAAAFQYAIWEVEGESAYSTSSGGLTLSTGVVGLVNQAGAYLSALTSGLWTSVNGVNLAALTNYTFTVYQSMPAGSTQSFLAVTSSDTNNANGPGGAVPEPATVPLVAVAALAWFGSRRYARRRAAAAAV